MQISNLKKHYGKNVVLEDLTYSISNSCTLILGDNGSGKTTLFKILGGIIKEYSGDIDVKDDVSLLLDEDCLFQFKSGIENIEYFLNKQEEVLALKYAKVFLMDDYISNKVKTYSSGMKKKLSLIISMARDKKTLLLDEPTNYLDVKSVDLLKQILIELKKEKQIIISSHDVAILDDILIDDIALLKNHKLIKINRSIFAYDYYMVKTINPIQKISYEYFMDNDYYVFKVKKDDFNLFSKEMSEYIIKEMTPLSYFHPVYLGDLYEKDN